jgi:hypothetical protein
MLKTIQYAFNDEGVYARYGDKVAFTVLDFAGMKPENGFQANYFIEIGNVHDVLPHAGRLLWTKKIPVAVKNAFRQKFGMKPLKDDGKPVLWGGLTRDQYLCKEAREALKGRHEIGRFKNVGHNGKPYYVATCKKCGAGVGVNPQPAPNEVNIGGDVFGKSCK